MSGERWQKQLESADGLSFAMATVDPPDGPYPAMVYLEFNDGSGTLLERDATELALLLLSASDIARVQNRAAVAGSPKEGK